MDGSMVAPDGASAHPSLIHASLGSPDSKYQTPSPSSIGSAVFTQFIAEIHYTLQRAAHFPLKLPLLRGSNTWFLWSIRATAQTASRLVQPFSHSSPQTVPTVHNRSWLFTQNFPFPRKDMDPILHTRFLGLTRVVNPNGISTASAVFAGLTTAVGWLVGV